ncbi:unnamed protein product, partial [Mesorhabditis belari]|uniref:Protein kinase domain-containing protein n=1 Tax=Mesorhabditis belari TaxID=2138241 RepID=A0AAF3FG15_9BILA
MKLFRHEFEALSTLKHQNIGEMIGWNPDHHGYALIFLKYISKRSLADVIFKKCFRYSAHTMVYYLIDLLNAVMFMHSNCLLHRDLKPSNIMLDEKNRLLIIDFETTVTDFDQPDTFSFRFGTDQYRPPEIFTNNGERPRFGKKGDTFAIGIILWEMIRRRRLEILCVDCSSPKEYRERLMSPIAKCHEKFEEIVATCTFHSPELRASLSAILELVHKIRNSKMFEAYDRDPFYDPLCESIHPPEGLGMELEIEESIDPPTPSIGSNNNATMADEIKELTERLDKSEQGASRMREANSILIDHVRESRNLIKALGESFQREREQREHTDSAFEKANLYFNNAKNQMEINKQLLYERETAKFRPRREMCGDMSSAEEQHFRQQRPRSQSRMGYPRFTSPPPPRSNRLTPEDPFVRPNL